MSSQGSNDDCYFYFYSSCTKGEECPFRHCEAALGTEIVCSLWREGRCFRNGCKFRHMESRISRGNIQCYWEEQPGGCLKPHCVFMHRKPKSNAGKEGLIMPVSSTPQTSPLSKVMEVKDTVKTIASTPVESYSSNVDNSENCPASIPIEPIVFSFDNEESDSESASSTPMKSLSYDNKGNIQTAKKDLLGDFSENKVNFGIKTLEQIKMERIHKESDNFYKSAYDAPLIDPAQVIMTTDVFKPEVYPPKADFISVNDRTIDTPICTSIDSSQHSPENQRNFKNRTLKRKPAATYSEKFAVPAKKVVCLKKSNDFLDFKIKTLDEIRQEKKNKSVADNENSAQPALQDIPSLNGNGEESTSLKKSDSQLPFDTSYRKFKLKRPSNESIQSVSIVQAVAGNEDSSVHPASQDILSLNGNEEEATSLKKSDSLLPFGTSYRRLKLKRPSNESIQNFIIQAADSPSDNQKNERTQMILHEVQNISEGQNKVVETKGKRKETQSDGADVKSPKQLKTSDSILPKKTTTAVAEGEQKPVKSTRPIIKRQRSTSFIFQSPVSTLKETVSTPMEIAPAISPPKEMASTTSPSKKMECTTSPSKEIAPTISPSKEIVSTISPTKEMASIISPTKEMASTISPSKEIAPTISPKKIASTISPSKEIASTISSPKERASTVSEIPEPVLLNESEVPVESKISPKTENLDNIESDTKFTRKSSVEDEIDIFLNEADVNLDYDETDVTMNGADDLLLEIEQLLDS